MHRTMWLSFCLMLIAAPLAAEQFRYEVRRDKLWGGETGVLTIGEEGIAYASDDGKTIVKLPYRDIRKLDIADRSKVAITTYERKAKRLAQRQGIELALIDGVVSDRLAGFLADRLERPVLGSAREEPAGRRVSAYHRHLLGGCNGILVFGADAVHYVAQEPKHSRTWPFEDIETIGSTDPFHFRVSTYVETYSLELKERLPEEAYRRLWLRIFETPTYASPGDKENQ